MKPRQRNFKQKLPQQWFSRFVTFFFQQPSSFPKLSVTKIDFNGINFNYTYRLHIFLVTRIFFEKNLIYPEVLAVNIWVK